MWLYCTKSDGLYCTKSDDFLYCTKSDSNMDYTVQSQTIILYKVRRLTASFFDLIHYYRFVLYKVRLFILYKVRQSYESQKGVKKVPKKKEFI